VGGNSSAHGSVTPPPQPLNFGPAGSADVGLPYMSTESLLRKIQALLKAAADKIRDDERSLNFEKGTRIRIHTYARATISVRTLNRDGEAKAKGCRF